MLERVMYVSRATPGVTLADAYDIIRTAHNRNSEQGLTGALVLIDDYFVQVLEGDSFHLRERYSRIAEDPRHGTVELRDHRPIPAVSFPGEWMALRDGSQVTPQLKQRFGYRPGFSTDHFDSDHLHAFMVACWQQTQAA